MSKISIALISLPAWFKFYRKSKEVGNQVGISIGAIEDLLGYEAHDQEMRTHINASMKSFCVVFGSQLFQHSCFCVVFVLW